MRITTRPVVAALFAASVALFGSAQARTVSYPAKGKPSFTVQVPDSWTVTPAKEAGDYTDLGSEGGAVMQLRTMDASDQDVEAFLKDTSDYIEKNYDDVNLTVTGEDCTLNGLVCSIAHGTGKEKDGGAAVKLTAGVFALNDGKIGEIWYVAPAADTAGIADAAKIFNSYKSP
jgi:hypothetical protein